MKPILDFFAESYYTIPILMVCQIIASLVGYHHKNKFVELKYFHLYPIASLTQGIFSLTTLGFMDKNLESKCSEASVVVFVFLEVLLFYSFLSNVIKIHSLKLILRALFLAFLLYSIAVFAFTDTFFNSGMIIMGEACMIIPSVCLYFVQLFRLPATFNIFEQPAFWINIGILFLFSCTLPSVVLMFSVDAHILSDSFYFFINFMGYSVLFLFVARAYLCRKENVISSERKYSFI